MENLNSEVFNKQFAQWGGLLDSEEIATYPDPLKHSFDNTREFTVALIKRMFPREHGQIYFDFIKSEGLNVIIVEHSPRSYLLGLFHESVMLLESAFMTLMSHPDVFPEIGDSSRGKIVSYGAMKLGWPNDVERENHAQHFFFQAFSFLLFHELGHIRHGHLNYTSKENGKHLYAESGYTYESCFDPTLSQALELQADTYGMDGSILYTKLVAKGGTKILSNTPSNLDEWHYHMWAFSISILFFFFEHFYLLLSFPRNRTHPHPRLRQHLIERISLMKGEDDKEMIKGISSGCDAAKNAIKILGWKESQCNVKEEFTNSWKIFDLLGKGL